MANLARDLAALRIGREPRAGGARWVVWVVRLFVAGAGAAGGAIAYFAFNGYQTSTMNCQTFSQVAFACAERRLSWRKA